MNPLRKLRGIFGTAIAWSVPWALVGGILSVGYFAVRYGIELFSTTENGARVAVALFQVGAETFAVAGALAGAAFAVILALRGVRTTFEQLTAGRVALYGAIGGAVVGSGAVALVRTVLLRPIESALPFGAIGVVLGAASALAMLLAARRAVTRRGAPTEVAADPRHLVEASWEVERLLGARNNLTPVGTDGRASEAAVEPPLHL